MDKPKSPFLRAYRQRLNIKPIFGCLFLPWLLFCAVFFTVPFYIRVYFIWLAYIIVILVLILVLFIIYLAYKAVKEMKNGMDHDPTWIVFLAFSLALALFLAVVCGEVNYVWFTEKYYNLKVLHTYSDVSPSLSDGGMLMDAGIVTFSDGMTVDTSFAMGFRNDDVYCVAPMTDTFTKQTTYDFWLYGKNCCSAGGSAFHCTNYNNANALSGIRLMDDSAHPYYRLAVQQAEAAYSLTADHPLFFELVTDGSSTADGYLDDGYIFALIGVIAYFLVQLLFVIVAALVFAKARFV